MCLRRDVRPTALYIIFVIGFMTACASIGSESLEGFPRGIPLRGRVLYPDGSPASGANVRAETICRDSSVHFVADAVTDLDGGFVVASFDPFCGEVRFTAEYRSAFWLRTGEQVFYAGQNGTTPEIDLKSGMPPEPVTIRLEARGGAVELRVWDEATRRFIQAGLIIGRSLTEGRPGGGMSIATGKDGSSHTLFLPIGIYTVSLWYYPCGIKTYFASEKPEDTFEIVPTERISKTLTVNTFELGASSSYDNPGGEKCRPPEN
jgi:hypothetical protein